MRKGSGRRAVSVKPIAKECAERFRASPVRIASVLDTVSCIVQGVIPYGAQVLIAIGVAKGLDIRVDSLSLLAHLYYQPILALAVAVATVLKRQRAWRVVRHDDRH